MRVIAPIQTEYKGYLFRSRLEARWAHFFTLAGLRWEYEPEGFHLPSGAQYLPDFKVYFGGGEEHHSELQPYFWAEVKPENVINDRKFDEFASCVEMPDFAGPAKYSYYGDDEIRPAQFTRMLTGDPYYYFGLLYGGFNMCPRCLSVKIGKGWPGWASGDKHLEYVRQNERICCMFCDITTPFMVNEIPISGTFSVHTGLTMNKMFIYMPRRVYSSFRDDVRCAATECRMKRFGS